MVTKRFQHPARLSVRAAIAGSDDPNQFCFQAPESINPLPDFYDPFIGAPVCIAVRVERPILQSDQFSDGVKIEPKLARMGDERKTVQVRVSVSALTALSPTGVGEKATPLVIADRGYLDARALRQRTDGMSLHNVTS